MKYAYITKLQSRSSSGMLHHAPAAGQEPGSSEGPREPVTILHTSNHETKNVEFESSNVSITKAIRSALAVNMTLSIVAAWY